MHELSIVQSVVETVEACARDAGAQHVESVTLRVGALSGVVRDSLRFCFDVATKGTSLEGARLEIEEIAVVIFCQQCGENRALDGVQSLRCPVCKTLGTALVQGRELEVDRIEIS